MAKRLSEQELEAFRRVALRGDGNSLIKSLVDHIDAVEEEQAALMTRAMADADRVGNAYIEFTNQQTAKIEALEAEDKSRNEFMERMRTHILELEDGSLVEQLVGRVERLLRLLEDAADHLSNCVADETDPEGIVMRIKAEVSKKANGPG